MRERAISEITKTIEGGEAILRGDIDLALLNAPIPEAEQWKSSEDAAHPLFVAAFHYIQFAINLGLLDREKDAAVIHELGRRTGFIKAKEIPED